MSLQIRMADVLVGHRNPVRNAIEQCELDREGTVRWPSFNRQYVTVGLAFPRDDLLGDDGLLFHE